ncbi:hypothetical protein RHMOL_Rhmol07G0023700 [Rhododendron molle]|nr:hypothetical protein RHMOL_Rhmol07G0023700 [Rhododendron molle]
MHKAIKALFVTPQNNFRVFLNGSLILGGLGGGADRTSCMIGEAFENVLNGIIQADGGQRTSNFLHLVTEAISGSGLLDWLLEVQKLDNIDIEGAIHAYYNLVCQPCIACRDLGGEKLSARYAYLYSMSSDESLKIVRDYLIAATAKDLSLMISFRSREDRDVESPNNGVFLDSTNQRFEYKFHCQMEWHLLFVLAKGRQWRYIAVDGTRDLSVVPVQARATCYNPTGFNCNCTSVNFIPYLPWKFPESEMQLNYLSSSNESPFPDGERMLLTRLGFRCQFMKWLNDWIKIAPNIDVIRGFCFQVTWCARNDVLLPQICLVWVLL